MNEINIQPKGQTFHDNITMCQTHIRNMYDEIKQQISSELYSSPSELDVAEDMSQLSLYERHLIEIKNGVKKIKDKRI